MQITKTLITLIAILSVPAYAVTDQERSALHRLHAELETITLIIGEAEHASNLKDRKQVNYQRLRADLQKIQQGILDAASTVRRDPRSLPPVEGDYQ